MTWRQQSEHSRKAEDVEPAQVVRTSSGRGELIQPVLGKMRILRKKPWTEAAAASNTLTKLTEMNSSWWLWNASQSP